MKRDSDDWFDEPFGHLPLWADVAAGIVAVLCAIALSL